MKTFIYVPHNLIRNAVLVPLLLLAAVANAGTAPTPFRTAANILLQELQQNRALTLYPEEFNNLLVTISNAEFRHKTGNDVDGEKLYSMALFKAELLSKRLRENTTATLPSSVQSQSPGVFMLASSSLGATATQGTYAADSAWPGEPAAEGIEDGSEERNLKLSSRIVGGEGIYVVRKNDTLRLVASRLGVSSGELARLNHLKSGSYLVAGQKLKYNNRRIIPARTVRDGIIVNIPERGLYLFKRGKLAAKYPVAVGMSKKREKTIWRTPTGKFRIVDKKENPQWTVPPSIRKEMEENGEEIIEVMPPGPKNPLGRHAIKTSLPGILIHGTIRPTSINTYSSHGCIRVMPEDMEKLFRSVSISMRGEIIYQPIKMEVTSDGRVFLEVNHDIYGQIEDMRGEVEKLVNRHRVEDRVSWASIMKVIAARKGIAEEITSQ